MNNNKFKMTNNLKYKILHWKIQKKYKMNNKIIISNNNLVLNNQYEKY